MTNYLPRVTLPKLRPYLFRLGLIALLAAILGQATPTAPFSVYSGRGSAFDATTLDVVVLTHQSAVARQTIIAEPHWPLEPLVLSEVVTLPQVRPFGWPPRQTGPPPLAPWRMAPPLRGPPSFT